VTVGFKPIPDDRVVLIGTRDLDSLEAQLLADSGIDVIEPRTIRTGLARTLNSMSRRVEQMYVHLDLDVLDSSVAAANSYALSGGLTLEDVEYALSEIAREFSIAAITLSAYDPSADTSENAAQAAIRLISTAARVAERA
jgi:arginase